MLVAVPLEDVNSAAKHHWTTTRRASNGQGGTSSHRALRGAPMPSHMAQNFAAVVGVACSSAVRDYEAGLAVEEHVADRRGTARRSGAPMLRLLDAPGPATPSTSGSGPSRPGDRTCRGKGRSRAVPPGGVRAGGPYPPRILSRRASPASGTGIVAASVLIPSSTSCGDDRFQA